MNKLNVLQKVKQEGHDLVDEIVKLGVKKENVYEELRKRVGCIEGNEHFAKCYTIRECVKRGIILGEMLHERKEYNARRNEARRQAYHAKKEPEGLIPEAIAEKQPSRIKSKRINERLKNTLPLHEQRAIYAEKRERRAKQEADRHRGAEILAWTVAIAIMALIGYLVGYGLVWFASLLIGV